MRNSRYTHTLLPTFAGGRVEEEAVSKGLAGGWKPQKESCPIDFHPALLSPAASYNLSVVCTALLWPTKVSGSSQAGSRDPLRP